ncbi:unnamed protein product [Didymodactylos carnosus]|uniref:Tetraspanin n=1 Tax=Didymodactylos carnosus TaxID=1234261 RepID=A0A814K7F6_9BILA|nr:unnamed protein product [Didymodactylos carnosus]CAF1343370.1 unnamed protein product [Didymodactylos carnosus]CAF3816942.1 unnamed protein product [Didymodactylos carnosus]CAF4154432.1 unnamed protein product [Didymodactylos carnosus]
MQSACRVYLAFYCLSGVTLIYYGIKTYWDINDDISSLNGNQIIESYSKTVMVLGCLTLSLYVIGKVGIKHSDFFLNFFLVLLVFVTILQCLVFYSIRKSHDDFDDILRIKLKKCIKSINNSLCREELDLIQVRLRCCGIDSPLDWTKHRREQKQDPIPASCYTKGERTCYPYLTGCHPYLYEQFSTKFIQLHFATSCAVICGLTGLFVL